jgi:hypothetical protein
MAEISDKTGEQAPEGNQEKLSAAAAKLSGVS